MTPGPDFAPAPRRYVLIFRAWKNDGWPWWGRVLGWLLKPGYGHVSALWWDPAGRAWCYVDPCAWGLVVQPIDRVLTWQQVLDTYAADATAVVEVERDPPTLVPRLWGWLTCVSVIRALIGEPGWCWTPWQLYQRMAPHESRALYLPSAR